MACIVDDSWGLCVPESVRGSELSLIFTFGCMMHTMASLGFVEQATSKKFNCLALYDVSLEGAA